MKLFIEIICGLCLLAQVVFYTVRALRYLQFVLCDIYSILRAFRRSVDYRFARSYRSHSLQCLYSPCFAIIIPCIIKRFHIK